MRPRFDLAHADAITWLRALPEGSIDLAVTDPAYESLEKHRATGTTTRLKHSKASSNDWFNVFPNSRFPDLFASLYRALKKNAHLYLFCDQETMFVAKPMGEAAGFKFWKPIIWDKRRIGMGYHYRARYECILFFEKGKRRLNDLGVPDIIEAPRVYNGYPTEKPPQVAEVLIRQSTVEGELVADPFSGSGAFGVAALTAERNFAGTDTFQAWRPADGCHHLPRRATCDRCWRESCPLSRHQHGLRSHVSGTLQGPLRRGWYHRLRSDGTGRHLALGEAGDRLPTRKRLERIRSVQVKPLLAKGESLDNWREDFLGSTRELARPVWGMASAAYALMEMAGPSVVIGTANPASTAPHLLSRHRLFMYLHRDRQQAWA